MPTRRRNRYVQFSLLASLLLHLLFVFLYQQWKADQITQALQPVRFDQSPSTNTQRFEPTPPASVPAAVMEQLRLAEQLQAPPPDLPTTAPQIPPLTAEPLVPADIAARLQPDVLTGDTLDYDSTLQNLYRDGNVELGDGRLLVLPLTDITSEAGQRRNQAEQIIARAIEAMGGLEKLQAIRDKRIRVERWDDFSNAWVSAGTRYFRRGQQYLEEYQRNDGSRTEARGFDGRQSWHFRYGLHLPPRDERHNADRWDFLTRFRGDGVVAEYVGRRQTQNGTRETIRVIDTKHNRQRLAYFDVKDSLLESESEAGTTTRYVEYQRTNEVLTPFEVWVARPCPGCLAKYRWNTELNLDLTPDLFTMPPPITWEPELVHKVIYEHAEVPETGTTSLRLRIEPLTISTNPDTRRPYVGRLDAYQLNEFMSRKLRQAGVLPTAGTMEDGAADFRMLWNVDEYYDRSPGRATIKFTVVLQEQPDGAQWVGHIDHVWKPQGAAIDDRHADGLTYLVISQISAGMRELNEDANDHP